MPQAPSSGGSCSIVPRYSSSKPRLAPTWSSVWSGSQSDEHAQVGLFDRRRGPQRFLEDRLQLEHHRQPRAHLVQAAQIGQLTGQLVLDGDQRFLGLFALGDVDGDAADQRRLAARAREWETC